MADQTRQKGPPQAGAESRDPMSRYLRTVIEMAEELIDCKDMETLYRRAVELPREKLGLDRTGLFLEYGPDHVRSTFGTDGQGRTVDERHIVLPKDDFWQTYFQTRMPDDPRWTVREEDHIEFRGTERVVIGKGWIAATPVIRSARRRNPSAPPAILFNDSGITHAPFDPVLQDVVAVYGSILGEIIERRQAEQEQRRLLFELREAQRLESLGLMAGGVAHDFNNLLHAILGNAELARTQVVKDSPARECIDDILEAAARAAELSRLMLDFSGRGRCRLEELDINTIAREVVAEARTRATGHVDFTFEPASALPLLRGDPTQVRQVVRRLIENAVEAIGHDRGRVTVRTRLEPASEHRRSPADVLTTAGDLDCVALEVEDNGSGMTEEVRRRAFDPFFSTRSVGRGLGLASVLGIVRGHRGGIRLTTSPGQGATFAVLLPVEPRRAPESRIAAPAGTAAGAGALVIEDEDHVRKVIVKILEAGGVSVYSAASGQQGLEILSREGPRIGLVILDATMPFMSGEETLREIRRVRPDLPVLVASGYTEDDVAAWYAAHEITAFLHKPFQGETLLRHVRQALAGHDA